MSDVTDREIEALRKCIATAIRGDPIDPSERGEIVVLAADAIGKLRAKNAVEKRDQ